MIFSITFNLKEKSFALGKFQKAMNNTDITKFKLDCVCLTLSARRGYEESL